MSLKIYSKMMKHLHCVLERKTRQYTLLFFINVVSTACRSSSQQCLLGSCKLIYSVLHSLLRIYHRYSETILDLKSYGLS